MQWREACKYSHVPLRAALVVGVVKRVGVFGALAVELHVAVLVARAALAARRAGARPRAARHLRHTAHIAPLHPSQTSHTPDPGDTFGT